MSEEGQTKTDNGRLAREMVEREVLTQEPAQERGHRTHRNKQRRCRDGQIPKQREGRTKSVTSRTPVHKFGGSAKRQNFHCPPQTGAEGKSTKAPKSLELHQRPLSQQGQLHGNSRSVYTQGALCSRYRTPDRCTFSASHL